MSNPYRVIKQLAFLTAFCIVGLSVRAQQSYYIYLQSENGQPFYAQIGDKVYSSSAIGHLILAGLKDNVCNFEIGFPQHAVKPQQFSVQVRGKDHGYQLKKTGAQEWTLYNWQNQETVKALRGSGTSAVLYGERKKDDAFATLMAAVVNDSAVLYTSIVKNDAADVPQTVAKTTTEKPETNTEVRQPLTEDTAKEVKKTDVAVTTGSLTQTTLDSTKPYKAEKPLFDTASVAKVYKNDKPLFDTASTATAAVKPAKNEKPLYDTSTITARIFKEDKPLFDTVITTVTRNEKPLYDTTAAIAAKRTTSPKVDKKPGVVKVQETTDKDGETKLVFIDSSESPANVITVYISEDKNPVQQKAPAQPASTDPLAAGSPKTEPGQKTDADKKDKKDDSALKNETAAKTEPKKDPVKAAPVKQDAVETARMETLQPVTGKPAARKTDTLTIILESPQQKRDTSRTVKQEAPKPLYEPKQASQAVAGTGQPANGDTQREVNKAADNQGAKTDKQPVQREPAKAGDKPANAETPGTINITTDPQNAQQDAAKAAPESETDKKAAEPKKDTAVAKPETPKAVYNPNPRPVDTEKKKIVMINSDCARFASDNDVDKLRLKMLAENDMNKRVAIANKVFKTMCLYAKQMKALSELFPTDEAKYKFLEMAYPFAADTENFKELYELFTAESFQTKFKTLVRY